SPSSYYILLVTRPSTHLASPLSLHDALPILNRPAFRQLIAVAPDTPAASRRFRASRRRVSAAAASAIASSSGLRSPIRSRKSKRSEEHTSELQSRENLVCRLLLEKKKHLND